MEFFFDENFDNNIPDALNLIEKLEGKHSVSPTRRIFKPGIKDPNLIPKISKKKGVLVTFDRKALKAHIKLLKRHKVSVFALSFGSEKYSEKVHLILKSWKLIKEKVELHENLKQRPYFYKVSNNGLKEWK
ncbi:MULTISPECIES: PIN-like domain-containing protein [Maribacter]|uniref:Uncharacterized protein n=2 Tax=Maribacter cobaltidurans TaxID=1178778 RepID=A0A223V5T4_9FLAO|nr:MULTISPECIES: hypothetical protein [Maribacter]ASV30557.1 hypothetical protein CJ263_10230 [Maribacter cobaltidurans]MDC6388243.1 hypothetical protein [Maribacter sp. PR1]MEE1975631.1 hypothetical protein [Maribacter cobaltidurans]GGD79760.1 hypothetical protein GCM10011412_16950 [Maribacter cobaltidurans]